MEAEGLRLVGHTDLSGKGDSMGLSVAGGGYVYVAHQGKTDVATSIVDVSDPSSPTVVEQIPRDPGTHSHKVVVGEGLMLANCERDLVWEGPPFVEPTGGADEWNPGLRVYDASDPASPTEIAFFRTEGTGVHRMTFEPPYVYMSGSDEGYTEQFLLIVDLSDPASPVEAGRWWYPGMWSGGGERPRFPADRRYALHHGLLDGDLLFCGWWDAGLVILDVADRTRPQLVANLNWGPGESGATHSALPLRGRNLVVVTDEAIVDECKDIPKQVRVLDVSDPYTPRELSRIPIPEGDFCERGGRFGPHNLAEPRPHTKVETDRVYVAYFNAGLRVIDLEDPERPREIAHLIPDPPPGKPTSQVDDVAVGEDGMIYLTDRAGGGLHVVAWA